MNLYYIEKPFFHGAHAGVKPKNDLNILLKTLGFNPLQNTIQTDDLVFFYYPFNYNWEQAIFAELHSKQIEIILFVMDIRSITYDDANLEIELATFNKASYLIVHNEKMEDWLKNKGVIKPMFCLGFFDYLINPQIYDQIPERLFSQEVVFAGCLHPDLRKFLYDKTYTHEHQLNVYGPDFMGEMGYDRRAYFGTYLPEEIPVYLKGSFGLHWNGASKESCTGRVAEYSKIATSHKISLYLIAKLPIICWENSSEATFIKEKKLGFLIGNLAEIDYKLSDLTKQDYEEMLQNVTEYSKRIYDGYYFKRVIKAILGA